MSETITLEFIGATLRAIQAEQRTLRLENELIRKELGRCATRDELLEVLRVIVDRIANFEALMETRFDAQNRRMDQMAGRIDEMGGQVGQIGSRLDQIGSDIRQIKYRLDLPN